MNILEKVNTCIVKGKSDYLKFNIGKTTFVFLPSYLKINVEVSGHGNRFYYDFDLYQLPGMGGNLCAPLSNDIFIDILNDIKDKWKGYEKMYDEIFDAIKDHLSYEAADNI